MIVAGCCLLRKVVCLMALGWAEMADLNISSFNFNRCSSDTRSKRLDAAILA